MEPIEFLRTAEVVLEKESVAEVECRNAASRAYYSAYHFCLDLSKRYLATNGSGVKKDVGMHEKLIQTLCEHQDVQVRAVGYSLRQVKTRRVKADYKLAQNFTLQDAQFTVKSVQKLLQEISKIEF